MREFDTEPSVILPCTFEDGKILTGKRMRIDINKDFNEMAFILESDLMVLQYRKIEYVGYYLLLYCSSQSDTVTHPIYLMRSAYAGINIDNNYIHIETKLFERLLNFLINRHEQ